MNLPVQRRFTSEIIQHRRSTAIQSPKDTPARQPPPEPLSKRSILTQVNELRNAVAARGLGLLPSWTGPNISGAFGILMYHRVAVPHDNVPSPTWNVNPTNFRAQLAGLLKLGYQPWPLQKALAYHRADKCIPAKTFVITFDDGYGNVYHNALPVLCEYHIPATVFLATAYLDSSSSFPFDEWRYKGSPRVSSETWKPITTAQCEEMLSTGLVELGTHTHSHADFRGRQDELRRDLATSLEVLQTRFGVSDASFAFPFGYGCRKNDGSDMSEVAKEVGLTCALTTDDELVRQGDDPFNWGRFAALNTDSAASLAAKLDGRYSVARRAWRWIRRTDRGKKQHDNGSLSHSIS